MSLWPRREPKWRIAARLGQADPNRNEGWTVSVFPFEVEDTAPNLHRALWVLLAAVAFLLLIACVNLANLTLARATLRSREIAVRLALGATRGRIISQLVSESLMVSVVGRVFRPAAGALAHTAHPRAAPTRNTAPRVDRDKPPGIAFAAAASLLTTLLFGLAPSIVALRADRTPCSNPVKQYRGAPPPLAGRHDGRSG